MNNRSAYSTISVQRKPHCVFGFTLLELLVAIAIASILLGVGAANLRSSIEKSQSTETLAKLRMDIVFTRGEAIKRGGWVGVCGSENGTSCANGYQDGWLVFHDLDRDRVLNNLDVVLNWSNQEHSTLSVVLEELSETDSNVLMFNYRGYPDRSVQLRTSKGNTDNTLVLEKTGRIIQHDS